MQILPADGGDLEISAQGVNEHNQIQPQRLTWVMSMLQMLHQSRNTDVLSQNGAASVHAALLVKLDFMLVQ